MSYPNRKSESMLVLSSQEKSQTIDTNSSFVVHLNNNDKMENVTSMHIAHIHIPNMFNNVREGLNTFTIKKLIGVYPTFETVTVPVGYYTKAELITAINTASSAAGIPFVVTETNDTATWTYTRTDLSVAGTKYRMVDLSAAAGMDTPIASDPVTNVDNSLYPAQKYGHWFTLHTPMKVVGIFHPDWGPDFTWPFNNTEYMSLGELHKFDYTGTSTKFGHNAYRPHQQDEIELVEDPSLPLTKTLLKTAGIRRWHRIDNVLDGVIDGLAGGTNSLNWLLDPGLYTWTTQDIIQEPAAVRFMPDISKDNTNIWNGVDNSFLQANYPYIDVDPWVLSDPGLELATSDVVSTEPIPFVYSILELVLQPNAFESISISSPTAGQVGDLLTQIMGFTQNVEGAPAVPDDPPVFNVADAQMNISGPAEVFIKSQSFAEANAIGGGDGDGVKLDQNIIDMVPLNATARGEYKWYQPKTAAMSLIRYKHKKNVSRVDIELTDINGRVLTLPSNYHLTMMLRLTHESLDG